MIEVYHRYRVHPAQARAFEHAYGPAGPWAALFATQTGFIRTRLFRHKAEPSVYVTVDAWENKADWDRFLTERAEPYCGLDRQLHLLYLEERLLGYYEGHEQYRASLDTLA